MIELLAILRQILHLPVPWYIATLCICLVEVVFFVLFGRWKDDGRIYDEEEDML